MPLYQNFTQMLYRARGVNVADLFPQKSKQPKKETLLVRNPLFAILALHEGLTIEQASLIHDYMPQKEQAQYK